MTSHAELSRDLALAIGYFPESVQLTDLAIFGPRCIVYGAGSGQPFEVAVINNKGWSVFDYRSPDVAMPLLVWLVTEHNGTVEPGLEMRFRVYARPSKYVCGLWRTADTLEEAIARAVIAVRRGR